ncbi:GDSL esterase/lipase At1g29670-like [Vitis riparia]|uniref:GDSL esterase/lipase At1g29670-like n=1 Tax=Vitis riparia TaxID=96939 RepID=UPI00155A7408|nr:GDSL esterase/lipase At1g29670-like [Vitis riparia]
MACNQHKVWRVAFLLSLLSILQICARGDPQVPCYFILGDSLSDNGNNNGLSTKAKANFKPYGIDFPVGPTGRFSNGRTIVDVTAELLGFGEYIPSFTSARGRDVLKGVNYASASAGILDESGKQLGQAIPLGGQLKNYLKTFSQISKILGGGTAAHKYLNKCMFTVGIGSNDFINNYFMPDEFRTSELYTLDRFVATLIDQYSQNLKTLYKCGARKVALFGLGAIGCAPAELARYGATPGSICVDKINDAVVRFNKRLISLVDDLNDNYKDAKFTYINILEIGTGDATAAGFKVTNSGCCGGQKGCLPLATPCKNRDEYTFWDEFHPTDAMNVIFANRAYKALTPTDAHPIDISTLASL